MAIEGPQFSCRAESRLYREWGADVIGMTAMPEARLAREAELPYALLGMVTDYDSWREGEAGVEASQIIETMTANAAVARGAVRILAQSLPQIREPSPIDFALDHAIVTDGDAIDSTVRAKLDAVCGRIFSR